MGMEDSDFDAAAWGQGWEFAWGMGTAAVSLYFSAKNVNNVDHGVMLRAVPNGSRIRIHKATDSSIFSL
jgi:hypothetical protein